MPSEVSLIRHRRSLHPPPASVEYGPARNHRIAGFPASSSGPVRRPGTTVACYFAPTTPMHLALMTPVEVWRLLALASMRHRGPSGYRALPMGRLPGWGTTCPSHLLCQLQEQPAHAYLIVSRKSSTRRTSAACDGMAARYPIGRNSPAHVC
jgi:hypothetical protein